MKYYLQTLLCLVLLSYSGSLCLGAEVLVRTKGEPATPFTGQKVILTIDVLAKDGWATINSFPLLEIPGAYLHRYETQGTRLSETVNGASYSGQRYELYLFAYKPGELTVEPFSIEITIKTWGSDSSLKTEQHTTKPIQFSVVAPDGVKPGEYLPVTSRLEAQQHWSSEEAEYATGDAVERTVTRKAEDVSGMVFAPFGPPQIDGMSCYLGQGEVSDTFNRGVLTGTRVDTMTCVFEKSGIFTFPERTVSYWDVTKRALDSIVLPETSFTVKGGPEKLQAVAGVVGGAKGRGVWLYTISFIAFFCLALFFFRARILASITRWRKKNHFYEKVNFKNIEKAVKGGDKEKTLAAIMGWLDTLPGLSQPARLDDFVSQTGNSELSLLVAGLQTEPGWNTAECRRLYGLLGKARKTYLQQLAKTTGSIQSLPPIGLQS